MRLFIPAMNSLKRVLYWLPLGVAFTHYCYTVKTVRGRSMQVRRPTRAPPLTASHSRRSAYAQSGHFLMERRRSL